MIGALTGGIGWIIPVLASRNGVIGIALVGLCVTIFLWDRGRIQKVRKEAAKQIVQASKKEGTRRNAQARKRRSAVPLSDAKRMLSEFARDR